LGTAAGASRRMTAPYKPYAPSDPPRASQERLAQPLQWVTVFNSNPEGHNVHVMTDR
jgi:hypothetical protein